METDRKKEGGGKKRVMQNEKNGERREGGVGDEECR